jgi:uncharacterized protein YeaO (DUF488 family)
VEANSGASRAEESAWSLSGRNGGDDEEVETVARGVNHASPRARVRAKRCLPPRLPMPIRIVQLGSPRVAGEGLRMGTVRRPPRGVPKTAFASRNYYDIWLPSLAPSEDLRNFRQKANDEKDWRSFVKRFRTEMSQAEKRRLLDLPAALSLQTSFSVGCYCLEEQRCHRSVLRELLTEREALFA